MISSPTAAEAVVTERFTRDFGYANLPTQSRKTVELLAAPDEEEGKSEEEERRQTSSAYLWMMADLTSRVRILRRAHFAFQVF